MSSLAVCVNPGRAFNCYWEMPFRERARFTLENRSEEQLTVYYQINYTLTDVPEDCAYFHAQFRRTNPLPYKEVYTILDGISGQRALCRHLHGAGASTTTAGGAKAKSNSSSTATAHSRPSAAPAPRTISAAPIISIRYVAHSGQGPAQQSRYQEFTTPYAGLPQVIRPDGVYRSQQRFGLYRWHILDPVRFRSDLRVTIQALGWLPGVKEAKYLPLAGRHRLGGVLVPDAADGALPPTARPDFLEIG